MVRHIILLFFVCVLAVPGYGYSSDKPKNLLVIGTSVAKPPQVAMKLLDEDTRILSY